MTKGNVTSWSSKKGGEKRKWQLLKKGQIKMLQAAVKFSYPGPFKYIIALQNLDFCTLVWSCYLVWITLLSALHTSRKARLEHAGEALITGRIPVPAAAPQAVPAQYGASAIGKPSLGTATAPGTVPATQHPHLPCRIGWLFLSRVPVSDPCTLGMLCHTQYLHSSSCNIYFFVSSYVNYQCNNRC